jgi:hypothetical protein
MRAASAGCRLDPSWRLHAPYDDYVMVVEARNNRRDRGRVTALGIATPNIRYHCPRLRVN